MTEESGPGRGRPRSETARRNVLAAARKLLEERGLPGLTVEGIAAEAGVGKPTIYRHWPNAQAVAMDAFLEGGDRASGEPLGGSPLGALRRQLAGIAVAFASPAGRSTAAMIAAAQNDSELAKVFRQRFIMRGRETGRALLLQAIEQGAVRPDLDLEVALDLIYAPLFFRLLIGHGPLDRDFTDTLLDTALEGCARL
jgi:AcrR family transcriptional regulator